jgi:hypothetical protein
MTDVGTHLTENAMTFTFDPPRAVLFAVAAIPIAAVAMVVLSRGHPARKMLGIVFAAVAIAVLLSRYHQIKTSSLTIDDAGIVGDTAGDPSVRWPDVEQAVYIPELSGSEYRPGKPVEALTAIGSLNSRYGWYRLANGDRALVALEAPNGAAVLIATRDTIYLFGPKEVRAFAQAVADHVPLSGWEAAQ